MKCQYVKDKFEIIEQNFIKARAAGEGDPQLAAMLSSYLVVIISGIYEDCIEYLFVQRANKSKDNELAKLVEALMAKSFRNPNYDKIKNLVGSLNPVYEKKMDSEVDTKSREGINGIYGNKTQVAHYGKIANATVNDVADFHNGSQKIFIFLESILL